MVMRALRIEEMKSFFISERGQRPPIFRENEEG